MEAGRAVAAALLCSLLAVSAAEEGVSTRTGMVVDRPVRFVNDRVLTIGDIRARNALRVELFRRAGRVLPDSRDGLLRFNRDTLEELTDEELLVQKADELKVTIDRDTLAAEVVAEARQRGLALRDVALLRRIRDREAKVDAVLGWFEGRAASVSPSELRASYDRRQAEFVRPARARTLLIALRPSGDDERREVVRGLAGVMRQAQESRDEVIHQAAAARLDAFLDANVAGQEEILATVAADISARAVEPGLARADADLARAAADLLARFRGLRTRAECDALLAAVRDEIAALAPERREEAFAVRATAVSQGPQAADGGRVGWVEPGTFGAEIEAQALTANPLEPAGPFWTGTAATLLLVTDREEGRTQSFAEVSAVLQASLDRDRRLAVRQRVTGVLRAQATISDVVDLAELLR